MNPQNNQPDTKNFILAIVLSLGILFAFQTFWAGPQEKKMREEQKAKQSQQVKGTAAPANIVSVAADGAPTAILSREAALALTQRIPVENQSVKGSISTYGARLDDISLNQYRDTTKKDSKNVTLLNPNGAKDGYYAFFGWTSANVAQDLLPGPKTLWKPLSNNSLTPQTPVVLEYDNGQGLKFTRKIEVDADFLFTYTDTITNNSAAKVDLNSYGAIRRHSAPAITTAGAFEGAVGILNNKLERLKYRDMEKGKISETSSQGGWFGFSDGYWMVALIPDQKETINATYKATGTEKGRQVFETSFIGPAASIAPGQTITHSEKLYSGAKKVDKLRAYEENLGLVKFDNAVDWGILWFLTKPFYWLLMFFTGHIGDIGLGMLAMTVVVKVVTFPLVYSSYKSFAKMRDLAPKMKEIQEKFPDDKARQQQETIKFYQTEKINPVAGCIPMLFQMPIFFALYKVLIVALEMRHAPFYGWIDDLSAKDPTTFLNLFGLLPFDVASIPLIGTFLMIGAWPILYGASYWLLSKMQPTATDPMQAQIFAMMPWLFVIIFASFASGLVIYYTWSNLLTIVQQYAIAKTSGNSNPIDEFFAKLGKKKASTVPK